MQPSLFLSVSALLCLYSFITIYVCTYISCLHVHARTHSHTHASLAGIMGLQTQPSKVGVLEFQRDHTSHSPNDPYAHLDRVLYFVRVLTLAIGAVNEQLEAPRCSHFLLRSSSGSTWELPCSELLRVGRRGCRVRGGSVHLLLARAEVAEEPCRGWALTPSLRPSQG